jgi:hypothetical protein
VHDDIAKARKLLSEYNISCKDKRQELENISSEILRIVTLVNRYIDIRTIMKNILKSDR